MSERHDLHAYYATLATLVLVFAIAMITSAFRPDLLGKIEAFGLGTITGGLIGILRIPNAPRPIATTKEGDVNVEASPQKGNSP